MPEVLSVLTYKSARHILSDGGTQSWSISQRRARRCGYVVCVRHQQGPYKAEGSEPHKHAFLVGKVSNVVPSSETQGRFRVEMSEYAVIDGPKITLNSASPTQYFPSLSSIGIDETTLKWIPIGHPLRDDVDTVLVDNYDSEKAGTGEGSTTITVLMQAKRLVADEFGVPLSAVEIVVRA